MKNIEEVIKNIKSSTDKKLFQTFGIRPDKLSVDRSHPYSLGHTEERILLMNELLYPKYKKNLEDICARAVLEELNIRPKSDSNTDIAAHVGILSNKIPSIVRDLKDVQIYYEEVYGKKISIEKSLDILKDTYRRMCTYARLMEIL